MKRLLKVFLSFVLISTLGGCSIAKDEVQNIDSYQDIIKDKVKNMYGK